MDSSLDLVPGRLQAAHSSWGVLEEGQSRMGKGRKSIHRDLRPTCVRVCVCVCVCVCRLHICTCVFQCVVCACIHMCFCMFLISSLGSLWHGPQSVSCVLLICLSVFMCVGVCVCVCVCF